MKKVFLAFLVLALVNISGVTMAQKYFTYDGNDFSVLFTCNNANTKVTNVEFSFNGEWVQFTLVGKTDLEGTKDGGFMFFCKDGKGDYYAIDYYRQGDYVLCHGVDAAGDAAILDGDYSFKENPWRLERRAE